MNAADDWTVAYELDAGESLSDGVVQAVARAEDAAIAPGLSESTDDGDVLDPLWSAIDPDALDAIFRPRPDEPQRVHDSVTFCYQGYEVRVGGDRRVSLRSIETEPAAAD